MVPTKNGINHSQTTHQTPIGDSWTPEFRGVPTETGIYPPVERLPSPAKALEVEPSESSYPDSEDGVLGAYLSQIGRYPSPNPRRRD